LFDKDLEMEINDAMGNLIGLGGLIVAFVSVLFSYLSNRENIKARRAEIVTEKSIEAFRDLVEKLNLFVLEKSVNKQGGKLGFGIELPQKARDDLFEIYYKYGLYFPGTIRKDILSLADSFTPRSEIKDNTIAITKAQRLIDRIQKHLGIETKEKRTKG
jgi:hypothetical protein